VENTTKLAETKGTNDFAHQNRQKTFQI